MEGSSGGGWKGWVTCTEQGDWEGNGGGVDGT